MDFVNSGLKNPSINTRGFFSNFFNSLFGGIKPLIAKLTTPKPTTPKPTVSAVDWRTSGKVNSIKFELEYLNYKGKILKSYFFV